MATNPVYQGSRCVDCDTPTSGLRCKPCHGKFVVRSSLEETAARDRAILAMVDGDERLSGDRLATRLGVSRTSAAKGLKAARRREARRAELGIA